jgi:hypothetical protein
MSSRPRIPRPLRGTDLQFAYLEGFEEGGRGTKAPYGQHREFCRDEWTAYEDGFRAGERQRVSSGKGGV